MKRTPASTLAAAILIALPAMLTPLHSSAQTTVKDSLAKHWKTSGEFTIAVADTMPAEDYNFRPNPVEMSFGALMAHIAIANEGACANASGLPRPDLPPALVAWSKDYLKADVSKD